MLKLSFKDKSSFCRSMIVSACSNGYESAVIGKYGGEVTKVMSMYSVYELCWLNETGTRSETFSVRGQATWSNYTRVHVKSYAIFFTCILTCLIKFMIIEKYEFSYSKLLKECFEFVFDECLNNPCYKNTPLLMIKGLGGGKHFLDQLTSTHQA